MTITILILCILLLVVLITWAKVNAFLAFTVVSLAAGLLFKMPFTGVVASINKGIGDTLGSVVIIIVLGAMLGNLVAKSGAAHQIAQSMRNIFGPSLVSYAMALTGVIVGIPLYYNTGFILLIPIVFSVAQSYRLPPLYVGLPMLAALSVMHGFLPPHPSPMTLVKVFHADVIKTFFYGLVLAVPAIIIAGPVFAVTVKKINSNGAIINDVAGIPEGKLPGVFNSFASSLLPVLLVTLAYIIPAIWPQNGGLLKLARFLGEPVIAMVFTIIIATCTLGLGMRRPIVQIMGYYTDAVKDIAMILLIIGSAGALKQIFIDGGASAEITGLLADCALQPLMLAWVVTAGLRLCLGSATVAGLTAAGVLFPATIHMQVNPNLLVLAIGAGSLFGSHVNDTAFWLCKEYFNLSMKDTFRSWTVMESLVSVIGLIGVLSLNYIL
ncbi:MAG: gluconate:H+ symporter [Bacteroidota bacterium]